MSITVRDIDRDGDQLTIVLYHEGDIESIICNKNDIHNWSWSVGDNFYKIANNVAERFGYDDILEFCQDIDECINNIKL